jgi:hypothetical protein
LEYGSSLYNSLTGLKGELGVDEMVGVHVIDNPSSLTSSIDIVKNAKEYMKT